MNQILRPENAKEFLLADLKRQDFDDVRVLSAHSAIDQSAQLLRFLGNEFHGEMSWMRETAERRASPQALWREVQSIVLVAMRYTPGQDYDPLGALSLKNQATISCYAHNRDYHDVIKGKLKQAAGRFAAKTGRDVKVFVDTAPVMEKPLGQKAGLGWQGKHTNLVSRGLGSWFFIGSIFTDMLLPADQEESDHCGSCQACLDVCPTHAFPAPYQLDARRCISYLTIEHSGPIPHEFREPMGNRVYGCDDCLAVCPWNKFAQEAREAKLQARADMKSPKLAMLLTLDDADFRTHFSGSPIKRIGRNRFMRNCLMAAGNSEDASLVGIIETHLNDNDPIVRGAAIWALSKLKPKNSLKEDYKKLMLGENDMTVNNEWQAAINEQ